MDVPICCGEFTEVSILHKCDYNIRRIDVAPIPFWFQFYISAIITLNGGQHLKF